jgi:CRISPR-associated endonuclease/helicase Cas3
VLLDEAHIAEPLRRTVEAIAGMQASAPRSPRPALRLCSVSATHEAEGGFELSESERHEPAIARRIAALKTARLVAKGTTKDIVKLVRELTDGPEKVIGVVLNTVADARAAFDQLNQQPMTDGVLLIGPVRSLDRADLLAAIPDRERRAERDRPFIVVATQTIEVGVDLDFDALITACAPLDALVQRFGRLDRAGELGTTRGVVLAPPAKGCRVYGETAEETWQWLTSVAHKDTIDFGVEALRAMIEEHGAPPSQPPPRTIRLLDLHVDALTVTDATDEEGPDVELLLHGDRRATADVAVAWRQLPAATDGAEPPSEDAATRELELRPLHPSETVTLSLAALQRWLAGDAAAVLSDVESIEEEGARDSAHTRQEVTGWRIAADGTVAQILDPRSISPSDRVLLSARSGGLDQFGWAPESRQEVMDLGSLALRGPRVVLDGAEPDVATIAESLASGDLTVSQAARALAVPIARTLPAIVSSRPTFSDRVRRTAATLAAGRASLLGDGRVLVVGRGARTEQAGSGRLITLDEHQAAVAAHAARTLAPLDLDPALGESVRRAARHHDEGKRDPRFQAWLRGGSTVTDDPLAKAAYPYDPVRVGRLRESSGWPAGKRHELASAVAVQRAFPDDRLAVWLIATHHGRNRPFPAAVDDDVDDELVAHVEGREIALPCAAHPSPAASLQTLVELSREHGPWGLAFLEALLMSADRTVSATEATT